MNRLIPICTIALCMTASQGGVAQTSFSPKHIPNYIDSIQTAQQIAQLVYNIDNQYENFRVNESLMYTDRYPGIDCEKLSDSLKIRPWTKYDFDQNGRTDLLVVGIWYDHFVICILDKGNRFEISRITRRSFQKCTFATVENNQIRYFFGNEAIEEQYDELRKLKQLTLTYRFGDFIEENPVPANHKIEKIEYFTDPCLGSCPVFKMTIHANRMAKWEANMFNTIQDREFKGTFTAKISKEKYQEIIDLLNYINFEKLEDHYYVNWTDDQSGFLKITYNNGQVKTITDYGLIGTFGLSRVYSLLSELRENQVWKK